MVEAELNTKIQNDALTINNMAFEIEHAKNKINVLESELEDKHSICRRLSQRVKEVTNQNQYLTHQLELRGHTSVVIQDVARQLKQHVHDASGSVVDLERITGMFESLKIGSIVKTHFILLVKEIKTQHDESMRVLKNLQIEKEKESDNFKSTCVAMRKLYASKGGPEDGKYQRVIECLESQI